MRFSTELAIVAALAAGTGFGQPTPGTPVVFGAPPGGVGSACTSPQVAYMNTTTGCLATCASSTWSCTGGGGGAGLFYRGNWDSATSYSAQDVVSYGGSSYVGVAASTGTTPGTDSTKWLIFAQQGQVGPPGATGAPGTPGANGNGLLDGGGVAWTGNLVFLVSAASYVIAGTNYTSAQTSVTLAAADPSNPRIDVIAVDSTGTVIKITGTAAASPAAPTVDPSTQLALTFVTVGAGATTPSNIASTLLYDENAGSPTEWNATKSGAGLNLASTNNPFHGTIDVEATALATGNFVQLQIGSGSVDLSTQNVLVFYIRSKAAWNSKRTLNIQWQNAGTLKGQAIVFREGSFGFASANTTAYQQIVIPTAQWQTAGQAVTQLVFTVGGSGGTPGFYLDYVQLQSGLIQQPTTPGMVWRGAWSSTTSYNVNDVVTNANQTWVALASSTNSTPAIGTTWAAVPAGPAILTSSSGPVTDPGGSFAFQFNNAAGALTFNAPVGVAGLQRCYRNAATRTGAITIQMAAANTVDIFGANGSAAGTLTSAGALGDAVCIVSDAANHWYAYISSGTWTATGASGGAAFNSTIRISQTVVGSPASSVTISSIPAGYTNLRVSFMGRTAKAGVSDDLVLRFNGDSGSNYTRQYWGMANATGFQGKETAVDHLATCSMPGDTVAANYAGSCVLVLPSYAATTFYKTVTTQGGWYDNTNPTIILGWGTWLSTTAINAIAFTTSSGSNFKTGCVITLYGEY